MTTPLKIFQWVLLITIDQNIRIENCFPLFVYSLTQGSYEKTWLSGSNSKSKSRSNKFHPDMRTAYLMRIKDLEDPFETALSGVKVVKTLISSKFWEFFKLISSINMLIVTVIFVNSLATSFQGHWSWLWNHCFYNKWFQSKTILIRVFSNLSCVIE